MNKLNKQQQQKKKIGTVKCDFAANERMLPTHFQAKAVDWDCLILGNSKLGYVCHNM